MWQVSHSSYLEIFSCKADFIFGIYGPKNGPNYKYRYGFINSVYEFHHSSNKFKLVIKITISDEQKDLDVYLRKFLWFCKIKIFRFLTSDFQIWRPEIKIAWLNLMLGQILLMKLRGFLQFSKLSIFLNKFWMNWNNCLHRWLLLVAISGRYVHENSRLYMEQHCIWKKN